MRQNKKNVRNDGGEVPVIVIVFLIVVVMAVVVIEIRMLYVSSPIMLVSISSSSVILFYSFFFSIVLRSLISSLNFVLLPLYLSRNISYSSRVSFSMVSARILL